MIREEAITRTRATLADLQATPGSAAGAARPGTLARLVAAWMRARRRTDLDLAMEREIRRYVGGRQPERGDLVVAERVLRELERRYGN